MAERKNHRKGTSVASSARRTRGMREIRRVVEALEQRTLLAADLSGSDCLAPASANWGQAIQVQSRIHNAGTTNVSTPFSVAYYLSNDTVFGDADDILLYTYVHEAIVLASAYGPSYNVNLTLPALIPAGYPAISTIYIGMKTDSTNVIAESNETNNFGQVGQTRDWDSLSVSPSYDLSGFDCNAPASATWGQTISVQSQIQNAGITPVTAAFSVAYYLSNDTLFGDADDVLLYTYDHQADVSASGWGPDYNVNLTLPAGLPSGYSVTGTVYIGMKTDSANAIAESNEGNNFGQMGWTYDWTSLTISSTYDLSGYDCYAPASGIWGQSISVQSQIRNTGSATVTARFYVDYYLSNDTVFGDADDVFLGFYDHQADVPASGLGPDYSVDLTLPANIPAGYAATGTVYIGMKTDAFNEIAESNEGNNFGAFALEYDWDSLSVSPSYDLSGYDCYAPASANWGQTISVQGQIRNAGTTTLTPAFSVAYYLSNDTVFGDADDILLYTYDHQADVPASGYGPDYNVNLTLPATIPAGYPTTGTVYIGMKTDSAGQIAESNETNNFGAGALEYDWDSLSVSPLYDLWGYDCYAPDSATWGQTISVDSQIRNTGTTTLPPAPFSVAYYLSNDTLFGDADDILLYTYAHPGAIPGSNWGPYYNVNLVLPATPPSGYAANGTIYIGMKTDSANVIPESNETNNFGQVGWQYDWDSISAVSPWDLSGFDCYAPASATWGQAISVQSQIHNAGSAAVQAPFYVDYYLSNDTVFGDADDIYLLQYDHQADVPASGTGPDYTVNLVLPATIPAGYSATGTVYIGMRTDAGGEIPESSETNNFGVVGLQYDWDSLTLSPSYDLSGWDILPPASANWGQTISVQSQIRNAGTTTLTPAFSVAYYLSNDTLFGDADDILLSTYDHQADVPGAGYGPYYNVDMTLPASIPTGYSATGTIYIGMKTDSANAIAETNETNNFGVVGSTFDWYWLTISPLYDLSGYDCYAPDTANWGQTISVQSRIQNTGTTTVTAAFSVTYYLSNDTLFGDADDILLYTYDHQADVPGSGNGPTYSVNLALPASLPASYPATGTVYVGMKTDSTNAIAESNEGNNFGALAQTWDWDALSMSPSYDLSGFDCYAPASATWGQVIQVQSQIRNTGLTTVTDTFSVAYYLSNDTVFGDADDVLLSGSYTHSEDVPANGYGPDFTANVTLPGVIPAGYAASGTVYIGMKTDAGNAVAESSETNNFAQIGWTYDWHSFTISDWYDLSGLDCYLPPSANWGQSISVQSQIRNAGTTTVTTNFDVAYYLSNDTVFGDADDVLLYTYDHQADVPGGSGPDYTVNVPLPASIPTGYSPTGTIYIGMKTDAAGEVTESNEGNNFGVVGEAWDWGRLTVSPSYDLSGWDCLTETDTEWGNMVWVDSQIRNAGTTTVTASFSVAYYLSNDTVFGDADDILLYTENHQDDVPAGGYGPDYGVPLWLPASIPAGYPATGTVYIGMKTDSSNVIAETNETNNFGVVGQTYDWDSLAVSSWYDLSGFECNASDIAVWGQTVVVQSAVFNSGMTTLAPAFSVAYYLSNDTTFGDADDILLLTYDHQADVPAGGAGPDYSVNLVLPATPPSGYAANGTSYIGMKTDSTNVIAESSETDNFGQWGQTRDWDSVSVVSPWELSGWDCYAPASATWGQTISVQSQIRNTGPAAVTAPFYVGYYLSNDTVFGDADDVLLYTYDHQADVPAGGYGPDYSVNLTLPVGLPWSYSVTGTVYIGMKTDSLDEIPEGSETNNFGVVGNTFDWASLTISSAYDLWGYDCYAPASATWGQTIQVQSQIRNSGAAAVTATFGVAYYLSNDTVFGDADDIFLFSGDHLADVPASGYGPDYTVDLTLPPLAPAGYAATGTIYIGMKTDSANVIAESNETNNFGAMGMGFDWDSLTVTTPNSPPTDVALSGNSVAENRPVGTAVGSFSSTDPDAGDTFTYTLVSGAGSTDNASFTISGNQLQTAASFNYEAKSSYAIRVRTTDAGGLWFEKAFTISITDLEEIAPTVSSTAINDGAVQRSVVKKLTVVFSEPVSLAAGAVTVKLSSGAVVPNTTINLANPTGDQKIYLLTFSGSAVIGGSLADGIYDLIVSASGVHDLAGNVMTANYTRRFHRLFGDSDGNKVVNALDYVRLKNTLGRASSDPLFNGAFDYEANNLINALDLARFRQRYGMSFSY